jgi:hypothetical protein
MRFFSHVRQHVLIHSQSIFSIVIFIPLALHSLSENEKEGSAAVLLLHAFIWFIALAVLVGNPKLRREMGREGKDYFDKPNLKRNLGDALMEIALGSGPFLGMAISDGLHM